MRNLIDLRNLRKEDISSLRTRVTFEKRIYLFGGQSILFPTKALDKKEKPEDVCGYLNYWADGIIVRHRTIEVVKELAQYSTIPVINAMTDRNHPCEIISDMYSLSKTRADFTKDKYLFCGESGNIGISRKRQVLWDLNCRNAAQKGTKWNPATLLSGLKIRFPLLTVRKIGFIAKIRTKTIYRFKTHSRNFSLLSTISYGSYYP